MTRRRQCRRRVLFGPGMVRRGSDGDYPPHSPTRLLATSRVLLAARNRCSPARKRRFCRLLDVRRTVEKPVLLAVFVEVEPEQPRDPSPCQIRE